MSYTFLKFQRKYLRVIVSCMTEISFGISKLAILVKGHPKGPFSIAATPRCRAERYSFLWIARFYSWSLPYNAEC